MAGYATVEVDRVRVRILYLNHDFARYLGVEVYQVMNGGQANNAPEVVAAEVRNAEDPPASRSAAEEHFAAYLARSA